MVAWLAGNISDEATTPASNIFNEAMRPTQRLKAGAALLCADTIHHG
jgi:hypothetical protein